MLITYGQGEFTEGSQHFKGRIMLNDHRLYLQSTAGDLAATFIPLEKIIRIRRTITGVDVRIRASMLKTYRVLIKGSVRSLNDLTRDLVHKRNLRKHFIWPEWFDASA